MRHWPLVLVLTTGTLVALGAQEPAPRFEVASVVRNVSTGPRVAPQARPGGTFLATGSTVAAIAQFAYRLRDDQLVGGPGWIRTDRFDITARAEGDPPDDRLRLMVQALLEDRFRLVAHRDTRDMRIHTLTLARDDGRLGPALRQADAACGTELMPTTLNESRSAGGGVTRRQTCAPLTSLVSSLSATLRTPVSDRTGLTGRWDYELSFTGEPRPGAAARGIAGDPNDGPALFTAVQEQLGLRLQPTTGPVEVLVIDAIEPPTEN